MSYLFKGELFSNIEFCGTPDMVEVTIGQDLMDTIPKMVQAMKDLDTNYMVKWWAGSYEFFVAHDEDDEDDEDEDELPVELTTHYEPYDGDMRVDGCTMKVYSDGHIQFVFTLKYVNGDCWSQDFKLTDCVKQGE